MMSKPKWIVRIFYSVYWEYWQWELWTKSGNSPQACGRRYKRKCNCMHIANDIAKALGCEVIVE